MLIRKIGQIVLLTGMGVFFWGILTPLKRDEVPIATGESFLLTLSEREVAIQHAELNGLRTYSYETNFVPGIGRIGNPGEYRDQRLKDLKKLSEDLEKLNFQDINLKYLSQY